MRLKVLWVLAPAFWVSIWIFSWLLFPNYTLRQIIRYLTFPSPWRPGSGRAGLSKWLKTSLQGRHELFEYIIFSFSPHLGFCFLHVSLPSIFLKKFYTDVMKNLPPVLRGSPLCMFESSRIYSFHIEAPVYIDLSFSHTQYLVLFINNIESLPKLEG